MTEPSKDPTNYQEKQRDKEIKDDPCVANPEFNAFYQCGITDVHKDLVPRKGQCVTPEPPPKKEI